MEFGNVTGRIENCSSVANLNLILMCVRSVNCCMTIVGICTNAISLLIFSRMGIVENGTSITLYALTVADFLFLVTSLASQTLVVLAYIGVTSYIPLTSVNLELLMYSHMFYTASVLLTVFLTVQKCCCVAMPFHYRSLFTTSKTGGVVAILTLICLVLYIPPFATLSLHEVADTSRNSTKIAVRKSVLRAEIIQVVSWFVNSIIPTGAQVVVGFCLGTIVTKLRQATKFRLGTEAGKATEDGELKLSGKELRAVQSVAVLAAMFIACTLPSVLILYASYIEPEFNGFRKLGYVYSLTANLKITLLILCSSLNAFVYLKFNTRYKQEFVASMGMKAAPTENVL